MLHSAAWYAKIAIIPSPKTLQLSVLVLRISVQRDILNRFISIYVAVSEILMFEIAIFEV